MKSGSEIQKIDSFSSSAKQLRAHFEKTFSNPLVASPERFCWDYWHIPNEYTLLRTPAYQFFPQKIYRPFHEHLVRFGRSQLGCHDISPPWLSCYIEGCKQEKHRDAPHGPWAFVYSLTPWENRKFRGGETLIYTQGKGSRPIKIPSLFNRLTLFNPSSIHEVAEVSRVHDPREGRLVIHGWFVQPRPFYVGPVSKSEIQDRISELLYDIEDELRNAEAQGILSLKVDIHPSGFVQKVEELSSYLNSSISLSRRIKKLIAQWRFSKKTKPSRLTLPLVFESN